MKQRVVTAFFIGIGFVLLYFVLPLWGAALAFGVFAAVGAWELLVATESVGRRHPLILLSMAAAFAAVPASVYGGGWHLLALGFVYMVCVFAFGVFDHARVSYAVMGKAILAGLLLPVMLAAPVRILRDFNQPNRVLMALAPWLAVWVCDSAALFVGRAFGKRKLAPYVSPKKTVAGFVGGLLGGLAAMLAVGAVGVGWFGWRMPQVGLLAFYGLAAAALGQLGDLGLSVIKREAGIKDYGRLFPGHGGVYDRFDSILFAAPLFELVFLGLVPTFF